MKPSFPHRLLIRHFDPVDIGAPGTLPTPVHHAVDGLGLAFEDGLDVAVGSVAHPAAHTRRSGRVLAAVPEEHTLHAPFHDHPTPHRHGLRPYAPRRGGPLEPRDPAARRLATLAALLRRDAGPARLPGVRLGPSRAPRKRRFASCRQRT